MKNIELTENQKVKLLEMCRILFPEYPDLQFGVKEKHNWSKEYLVFGLTGNEPIIHWFEFCITKLSVKILCQNKNIINSSYSKNYFLQNKIINSDEHIVNYLYKEFKKIKINV